MSRCFRCCCIFLLVFLLILPSTFCAPATVPVVTGNSLALAVPPPIAGGDTVSKFRFFVSQKFPTDAYLPTFCSTAAPNPQLELDSDASGIDTALFRYIFVVYEEKAYFLFLCPGTTYRQLKELAVRRIKSVDPNCVLKPADLAFEGIRDEKQLVSATVGLRPPVPGNIIFNMQEHSDLFVTARKQPPPIKKATRLDHITRDSFKISIPDRGDTTIENYDAKLTVGHFRGLIEAAVGSSSNLHKTLAICKKDGTEAADSDLLSVVFGNTRQMTVKTLPFVDWTAGKRTENAVSYCDLSKIKEIIKRGLPSTWDLVADANRIPAVYKYKKEYKNGRDRVITDQADFISLSTPVDIFPPKPADNQYSQYYVMREGALIMKLSSGEVYLPNGLQSSFAEIRNQLVAATDQVKGWLYPFCSGGGDEINPNAILETHWTTPNFLEKEKVPAAPPAKPAEASRRLLVIRSGGAAENNTKREYAVPYCTNSTLNHVATRLAGLLKLNTEDKMVFHLLDQSGHAPVSSAAMSGLLSATTTSAQKILALIGRDTLPTVNLNDPLVMQYLTTSGSFGIYLTGIGVGLPVTNVNPLITVKALRQLIMSSSDYGIEEGVILRYPFCVPAGFPNAEEEMDEDRTFASYGIPGSQTDITFSTKVGKLSRWTEGPKGELMTVGICQKSKYGQVVKRCFPDMDSHALKKLKIIVEDVEVKGQTRKSFEVGPGRTVDKIALSDPPDPDRSSSTIYVTGKNSSVIYVREEHILVSDPETTPATIIRDHFAKKLSQKSWTMAFCAPETIMYWLCKELGEESLAHYGFRINSNWMLASNLPKIKITYKVHDEQHVVDMEYCPMSTPDDIAYRLLKYSGLDPAYYDVKMGPDGLDYPGWLMWKLTGNTTFIPNALRAEFVQRQKPNVTGMKPTAQQFGIPKIQATADVAVPGPGAGPGAGNKPPVEPVIKPDVEEQLMKALMDAPDPSAPDVLVFEGV